MWWILHQGTDLAGQTIKPFTIPSVIVPQHGPGDQVSNLNQRLTARSNCSNAPESVLQTALMSHALELSEGLASSIKLIKPKGSLLSQTLRRQLHGLVQKVGVECTWGHDAQQIWKPGLVNNDHPSLKVHTVQCVPKRLAKTFCC